MASGTRACLASTLNDVLPAVPVSFIPPIAMLLSRQFENRTINLV